MTKITLSMNALGTWVATWSGEGAVQIRSLFGTTTLPTPYSGHALRHLAKHATAAKNPGCEVVVRHSYGEMPATPSSNRHWEGVEQP